MRTRLIALTLALLAAALITAGCQSPDERDYVEEVNAIQTDMVDTLNSVDPTDEKASEAAIDEFGEQVDAFGELDAPESVSGQHDDLLGILESIEDSLRTILDPKATDADKIAAITEAQTAAQESDSVIDSMNEEFAS